MKQFQPPQNIEKGNKLINKLLNEFTQLNDKAMNDFIDDAQFIKTYQDQLRKNTQVICNQLKDLLQWLKQKSLGPRMKQNYKQMKDKYTKEINRNTRILENMVTAFYQHKLSLGSQASITVNKLESQEKIQSQLYSGPPPILSSINCDLIQKSELMIIKEKQEELEQILKEAQNLKLFEEDRIDTQNKIQNNDDYIKQLDLGYIENINNLENKIQIELLGSKEDEEQKNKNIEKEIK